MRESSSSAISTGAGESRGRSQKIAVTIAEL
jgi:hypothetical protein